MENHTLWDSEFSLIFESGHSSNSSMSTTDHATPQRLLKGRQIVSNKKQCYGKHEGNVKLWGREISRKFNSYRRTVEEFLCDLAYHKTRYLSHSRDTNNALKILDKMNFKDEKYMYQPLVKAFNQLVAHFPKTKCLQFVDSHSTTLSFPYSKWADIHGKTRPDLVGLFPGRHENKAFKVTAWSDVSLVLEVKGSEHVDPMQSNSSKAVEDRIQLMRNARHVLLEHGALACFVIGVYGENVRIYRFDHASSAVSLSFNYRERPDLLRKFLWRFVHPTNGSVVMGADDLSSPASESDLEQAEKVLSTSWDDSDLDHNRWVTVPLADPKKPALEFLLLRSRSLNSSMFSRATHVREAIMKGDKSGTRYIIKEYWRQLARASEVVYYERIQEYVEKNKLELFGVANLVCGCDLGERERKVTLDANHTFHYTMSASVGDDANSEYKERSHMRLILSTVGVPLEDFLLTKELAEAIRDAIRGHRLAYLAGVLHRDVSNGNVMIARNEKFKGFIDDFDYSSLIDSSADGGTALPDHLSASDSVQDELKERTGTFPFLAMELLNRRGQLIVHRVAHDLESFYWLLLWIVLRHADHSHPDGNHACDNLFGDDDESAAKSKKQAWFMNKDNLFGVRGNKPLTHLLSKLFVLVYHSIESPSPISPPPTPLAYDSMLAAFDEALDMDGWPDDDPAIPFTPPKSEPSTPTKADVESGVLRVSGKRSREEVDDEHDDPRVSKRSRRSAVQRSREPESDATDAEDGEPKVLPSLAHSLSRSSGHWSNESDGPVPS